MTSSPLEISHLFTSNSVPNPLETQHIRKGITNLKTQIVDVESHLDRLHTELRQHLAVLSPVRLLPLEVLGDIFTRILPPILDATGRASLINLSLVCRAWCEAARSTLSLWGAVELGRLDTDYEKIVAWYNRSGASTDIIPKSLKWVNARYHECGIVVPSNPSKCESLSATVVKLLTGGTVDLDRFALRIPTTACFRHIVNALNAESSRLSLPQDPSRGHHIPWRSLRSLELTVDVDWTNFSDDQASQTSSPFNDLPHTITEFKLQFPPIIERDILEPARLTIAPEFLNRLLSFSIRCEWSFQHVLDIIKHCKSARELTIDAGNTGDRIQFMTHHGEGFHIPHLHTLRFPRLNVWALRLLASFNSPRLQHLDIGFGTPHGNTRLQEITLTQLSNARWNHFMQIHSDTLKYLYIRDVAIDRHALPVLFPHQLPALRQLVFDNVQCGGELFKYLKTRSFMFGGKWFPRLERLEVLKLSTAFDHTHLFAFLKERRSWHADSKTGEVQFEGPEDSLKTLILTYREQEQVDILKPFDSVLSVLKEHAGVFVRIDPRYKFLDVKKTQYDSIYA